MMNKQTNSYYLNWIEEGIRKNLFIKSTNREIFSILLNFPRKIRNIIILIFCLTFFLDLSTKWLVENNLVYSSNSENIIEKNGREVFLKPENAFFFVEEVILLEEILSINYIRNFNIGFSALIFLESYLSLKTIFYLVICMQLLVLALLIVIFLKYFSNYYVAFAFIFAGGCGNIVDRVVRGYVVDFVEWRMPWGNFEFFNPWPIFNVADISVTVGALLLAIFVLVGKREII